MVCGFNVTSIITKYREAQRISPYSRKGKPFLEICQNISSSQDAIESDFNTCLNIYTLLLTFQVAI